MEQRHQAYGAAYEILLVGPYYWLLSDIPKNSTVVDIGAFFGESAVYFATNPNVKKVLAYEASEGSYLVAKGAIARSPCAEKIELHNLIVSGNSGVGNFTKSGRFGGQSFALTGKEGKKARTISLNSIL